MPIIFALLALCVLAITVSSSPRAQWCARQLLPLTYRSRYSEGGVRCLSVWRMWFGRVFDHDRAPLSAVTSSGPRSPWAALRGRAAHT